MATNFANDTSVEELEKAPEEENDSILDAMKVEDDANVGEDPIEEVEEEKPEEEAPPSGPSPAMQELAKQWLPEKLVGIAKDDEQLQGMIELARESGTTPPPKEEPEFELSLPEDEVDEAVRKQFQALNDHYKGQVGQLKKDMGDIVKIASDLQKQQQEQMQAQHFEEQREFDSILDGLDSPAVGKYSEMTEGQGLIREAIFKQAIALQQKSGGRLSSHAESVARKLLPGVKTKQQKQVYQNRIREQSNGRLGNGNAQRLPEVEQTKDERFAEFIATIGERRKK